MRIFISAFIILTFLFVNHGHSQKYNGEFAQTEFNLSPDRLNFFKDMFETKTQFYNFLNIKSGETIAEIGADDGVTLAYWLLFMIVLLCMQRILTLNH